jgi:hypothetical protein
MFLIIFGGIEVGASLKKGNVNTQVGEYVSDRTASGSGADDEHVSDLGAPLNLHHGSDSILPSDEFVVEKPVRSRD